MVLLISSRLAACVLFIFKAKRRYLCCLHVQWVLFLGSWSASTSPARSPSSPPNGGRQYHNSRPFRSSNRNYGTTSLCQRSRSPSPTHTVPHQHGPPSIGKHTKVLNPILNTHSPFLLTPDIHITLICICVLAILFRNCRLFSA